MQRNIEAQSKLILSEIITEEDKDQAAIDVNASDSASWNSARLSIKLIDQLDGELEKTAIRLAVGILYGKSRETIRRRELVAKIIPPGVVQAHPLLTFSHWQLAAAARHLESPIDSALDIVYMIENESERQGYRVSCDTVYSWVYRDDNEYVKTVWRTRADSVCSMFDYLHNDSFAPKELRDLIGWFRGMLSYYLETGKSPLKGAPSSSLPPQGQSLTDAKGGHQG